MDGFRLPVKDGTGERQVATCRISQGDGRRAWEGGGGGVEGGGGTGGNYHNRCCLKRVSSLWNLQTSTGMPAFPALTSRRERRNLWLVDLQQFGLARNFMRPRLHFTPCSFSQSAHLKKQIAEKMKTWHAIASTLKICQVTNTSYVNFSLLHFLQKHE